jgi:glucan 1,4-alpha-glucosidase
MMMAHRQHFTCFTACRYKSGIDQLHLIVCERPDGANVLVFERHLDALQFIKDVAVDWSDSRYLEAEPGDYLTIARQAKGASGAWFVGAITDENARTSRVDLSFLPAGREYIATIYRDADDAHWEHNPMAYRIEKFVVTRGNTVRLPLAAGGGAAVSLVPANATNRRGVNAYR